MDSTKAGQELLRKWSDSQAQAWTRWLDTFRAADAADPARAWQATLRAWQDGVKGTLEAQAEASRILVKGVASAQTPPSSSGWARQVEEMTGLWAEMQQQMWDHWFEMVRTTDFTRFAGDMPGRGRFDVLGMWRDMAEKVIAVQIDWARSWAQAEVSRLWAQGLAATEVPRGAVDWARQVEEMTRRWADMQRQMWDAWFDMIAKIDPSRSGGTTAGADAVSMLGAWQDMTQKAIGAHAEWARIWAMRGAP